MPKNILVTGGAQGIGRATARHLLSRGHRVFILDPPRLLRHLQPALPHDIRTAVTKAAAFFNNRIDVLVNNAGIARAYFTQGKSMEDPSTLTEWTAYLEANLTAPFLVSQAAIPYMERPAGEAAFENADNPGGCIVHVSSFRAHQSGPNCEGYGATKAGLLGLTHAMAVSAQPWGIRVNVVSPGFVSVKHECKAGDEKGWGWEEGEEAHAEHLTGSVGKGEDVAEAVEFLMGAGFVSGQEIVVDGGGVEEEESECVRCELEVR
ncbi:hypothetical protein MMC13_004093 [Lambiella insularis]|nr:hypothetical protein [Lambiella insularis]